jgi:TrmH family RNA methyltransferase
MQKNKIATIIPNLKKSFYIFANTETLTMLSKNQLKHYASLRQKKFRKQHNSFLAEGDKIVMELLSDPGFLHLKTLLAVPSFLDLASKFPSKPELKEITPNELNRISTLKTPNRAVLEIELPDHVWSFEDIFKGFSFYFENIQDPGNLGTIIRTADWFGIQNVFCSPGSVDVYNPKVIQATMGSISRVKVHYEEPGIFFSRRNEFPSGYQSFATALKGENIYKMNLTPRGIIFFGNESSGLSREIIQNCDRKISIARNLEWSGAESLNLSIATGIVCSEILRRKLTQNGN